ncbi:MAG: type II secretion system protein [Candidatus Sumerlaeota bacterium]
MSKLRAFTLIELIFVVATIAILAAIAVPNFLEAQTRSKVALARSDQAVMALAIRAYYTDYRVFPPNNVDSAAFFRACTKVDAVSVDTVPTPDGAGRPWALRNKDNARGYGMDAFGRDSGAIVLRDAGQKEARGAGKDEFGAPEGQAYPRWIGRGKAPVRALSPAFDETGFDLNVLTSPLAYFSTQIPSDPFSRSAYYSEKRPFAYINLADAWRGIENQQSGRSTLRYVLISCGPDTDSDEMFTSTIENPVKGPWIAYDPTNGTLSNGDLYQFGD